MRDQDKTKKQLIDELGILLIRNAELEKLAIKSKQLEEKLKKHQHYIRKITESTPDVIYVYDLLGEKNVYASKNISNVLGYTPEEFKAMGDKVLVKLIHPDDLSPFMGYLEKLKKVKDDKVYEHDYRMKHKDGHWVWIQNRDMIFTRDSEGNPLQTIGTAADITERKQAEEALKRKSAEWEITFNSAEDLIMLLDKEFNIVTANLAVSEFLQLNLNKIIGMKCYQLFHKTEAPPEVCPLEKMKRTKKAEKVMMYLSEKDMWIMSSGSPVFDDNGNLVGGVHIIKNINERMHTKEAMWESEKRFRELVELLLVMVFETDKNRNITFVNSAVLNGLGYSQADFKKGIKTSQLLVPKKKEKHGKLFHGSIRAKDIGTTEYFAQRKDGSSFPVIVHSNLITDDEGNVVGTRAIAMDITERKRAEEEQAKLQSQLIQSEKMAGIGTLTSGFAHEFNNLLQIMSGHSEYAQKTKKLEDMEAALNVVTSTSEKVSKIIKDLLTFSRKGSPEKEFCDITEPIESALFLTEEQLKKNNIEVVRKYERIPQVGLHKGEMYQVFLNLITNARDAMMQRGGKLEIGIKKVKHNVEIRFTDTGIGIEEENLGRVFEPFFTTKGAPGGDTRTQGVGLGLSVSYGVIERHGGMIEVESEAGKGTTFTIRLPAKKEKAKERIVKEKRKVEAIKTKPKNVLVVDDEEEICKMLTKWLTAEGHKVQSALTGENALNLFKKEHFDIVFLDIVMPGILGIDTLAEMMEISPKTKIFMITGKLVDKELWKELKAIGASGYLKKPFKIENIKNCIAKIRS